MEIIKKEKGYAAFPEREGNQYAGNMITEIPHLSRLL